MCTWQTGRHECENAAFPNLIAFLFIQNSLSSHLVIYPGGHFQEKLSMPISSSARVTMCFPKKCLFVCLIVEICDLFDNVSLFMLGVRKFMV